MEDSFLFWKRGHSTPVLMNRDMEEGGCVNTPGQAGRNELRPYKILVGAEGSMVEAKAQENSRWRGRWWADRLNSE